MGNWSETNDSDSVTWNRRDFMKLAGIGSAGLAFSTLLPSSSLFAADGAVDGIMKHHVVPRDKALPIGWLRSLYERGEREVWRGADLATVGMPVGGIAAGQLFLCGDGTLGNWEIFNDHRGSGCGHASYARRTIAKEVAHGFAVFAEADGKRVAAPLNEQGFADVRFRGEYPIGIVEYADETSPVRARLEAFSPFIPLNAKDSALPATMFHITVENVSDKPVEASVVTWLENPVARRAAAKGRKGGRKTRFARTDRATTLVHTAVPPPPSERSASGRAPIMWEDFESATYGKWKVEGAAFGPEPATGAPPGQQPVIGFEGKRFVNSFFPNDDTQGSLESKPFKIERKYLNFLLGGGNKPGVVGIRLLVDGKGVRGSTGRDSEVLDWDHWDVAEYEGKEAVIQIYDRDKGPWAHTLVDNIEMSDEPRTGHSEPAELELFSDFGDLVLCTDEQPLEDGKVREALKALAGIAPDFARVAESSDYALDEVRAHAFGTRMAKLAPGERRIFFFALAWYFPNTLRPDHECGHEYAARFADGPAVADYVLANRERLAGDTRAWRDNYYDSTLPYWLLDRLHLTVDCLATGTTMWWKSGRFWAWEGVISCHGTCTHVYNYAQSTAFLFPELERNVRELQDFGAGFHDSGLVGFRSDAQYAADGQVGTILKAWREHRMSADDAFLKKIWPSIKKALEFSIGHDANEDGIIEDLQHNTYDINYFGANTFVGSLYLAALRAAEEMGREVGDTASADRYRRIYESGRKYTEQRLWNGEHFVQDVDLAKHPRDQYAQGCLSDQLFGQNWAHLTGLGHIYSQDKVRRALESVWTYNWTTDVGAYNNVHPTPRPFADDLEYGLITCTWPKTEYLVNGTLYKEEVWTGIEYQVAATMVREGMLEEGLAICRGVHDRYHPSKRNPYNEVECGDFYARAMASWGVLLALSGFVYHGPKGALRFAPAMSPKDFRTAFTTAEGWGSFAQTVDADGKGRWELRVVRGKLRLSSLELGDIESRLRGKAAVAVDGKSVDATARVAKEAVAVAFPTPLVLAAGQSLVVTTA